MIYNFFMAKNYNLTLTACSVGYILQASINNLLPLLFVYFTLEYGIPLSFITVLISYNFIIQIFIDLFSSKVIIKMGYKSAGILSAVLGLVAFLVLGFTPILFNDTARIFISVTVAVTVMAIGSGLSEVALSPIVEALPFDNKSSKMSFLHSFYPLGHLFIILLATGFFTLCGIKNWNYLALALTVIPIIEILLFIKSPIVNPTEDEKKVKKLELFKDKTFILLFVLMICAGASEQAIAQWASYFAESGLKVSKTTGDLIGASAFALFMFVSRFLYGLSKDKLNLNIVITVCAVGLTACYLLSVVQPSPIISLVFIALSGLFVGIMWPGVYSIGGKLFSYGGTAMFSMLALGGDLGCTLGPLVVGALASKFSVKLGILVATVFPVLLFVGMILLQKREKNGLISIK